MTNLTFNANDMQEGVISYFFKDESNFLRSHFIKITCIINQIIPAPLMDLH